MMYSGVIALSALLAATVSAIPMHGAHHPHHKRDVVWVTETDIDTVVVPVTTTIWVDGAAPTDVEEHKHHRTTVTAVTTAVVSSEPASTESAAAYTSATETSETSAAAVPETTPATTSVYVAPTTTSTSEEVAPTTTAAVPTIPTTTDAYVAPTTTSVAAAATSATSSSSAGSDNGGYSTAAGASSTGDLTWYDTGLGACGVSSGSTDAIVAISEAVFDAYGVNAGIANPNNNPLCGRKVSITGADGSAYKATVVDRCTGCAAADLDLSQGFFNTVTNNGDGRVSGMKWSWE